MKQNLIEALRWSIVLLCGAFGVWTILHDGYFYLQRHSGEGVVSHLGVLAIVLLAGIPLLIAYMAFNRQYYNLVTVFAVIGAVIVCGSLLSLPRRFGIQEFLSHHQEQMPWLIIVELPVSLICLFGPFYAAAWFFRLCHRLATRHFYGATPKSRNA